MRILAIVRLRYFSIVRSATILFVAALIPLFPAVMLQVVEPVEEMGEVLRFEAIFAVVGWLMHAVFLSIAAIFTAAGRAWDDANSNRIAADLIDTAPLHERERFSGEALGTLAAISVIHFCCLPILIANAGSTLVPIRIFVAIESTMLLVFFFAGCCAAWLRRAPRTKFAATRAARHLASVSALVLAALFLTSRPGATLDAVTHYLASGGSPRFLPAVQSTIAQPDILLSMLVVIYLGTLIYYYWSTTRRVEELEA